MTCTHRCSGNCRHIGCHCSCGEFHRTEARAFSKEQEAEIERIMEEEEKNDGRMGDVDISDKGLFFGIY